MGGGRCVWQRVRQLILKQTGCMPFLQVAPNCLLFAQDTTKQRYLSRKATMGIFGLYEGSHIKRYWINQMLYWLYACICLRLLIWNAGRSHVEKIPAIWTNMLGQSKSALVPELRHGVHNWESFCKYLAVYFCFSAVWTVWTSIDFVVVASSR